MRAGEDTTLRPGSTCATPEGRVCTILRLDTRKKKPGTWWRVSMLMGEVETYNAKDLKFIYQEPSKR